MRRILCWQISSAILLALAPAWAGCPLQAQQSQQPNQQQSPPNTAPAPPAPQKPGQPQTPPPDDHKYDAFNAEKDIEVGTFYMHKGDVDAAIPRFEDAVKLRPEYGKPRLLLAEAYEKKHDPSTALKYYKEYLKVYPHAPDAKKIEKKIEKLEGR
jgi:tetratricopeptide (TPR) repeat protein